jgi:hypothetical protein
MALSPNERTVLRYLREFVGHEGGQHETTIAERTGLGRALTKVALAALVTRRLVHFYDLDEREVFAPTPWLNIDKAHLEPERYQPSVEILQRIGSLALHIYGPVACDFEKDEDLLRGFVYRRSCRTAGAILDHLAISELEKILVDGIVHGEISGATEARARSYFDQLRFVVECDGDHWLSENEMKPWHDGTHHVHGVWSKLEPPRRNKLAESEKAGA